jgi:hypothetical protein
MDLIRRHLTVAATLTDEFTDEYIQSVFHTLTDRFTDGKQPLVNHDITDGIKIHRYISSGNLFFGVQIPSVKPSVNGFFVFPTLSFFLFLVSYSPTLHFLTFHFPHGVPCLPRGGA